MFLPSQLLFRKKISQRIKNSIRMKENFHIAEECLLATDMLPCQHHFDLVKWNKLNFLIFRKNIPVDAKYRFAESFHLDSSELLQKN